MAVATVIDVPKMGAEYLVLQSGLQLYLDYHLYQTTTKDPEWTA